MMGKLGYGGIIFISLFSIFLLVGGIGFRQVIVQDWGVFAGLLLAIIAAVVSKTKLNTPPYFWVYFGFSALVGLDIMMRGSPYYSPKFFSLLLGGSFFYLSFYWISRGKYRLLLTKYLPFILFGLGYLFVLGTIWYKNGGYNIGHFTFSMIVPMTFEHQHIGVYWSLLLLILLHNPPRNRKYPWYFVITLFLGIYLITISGARSAFLGILVGVMVYYKDILFRQREGLKIPKLLVLLSIGAMLAISIYKPVRSINYAVPALLTLRDVPLGFGVGKFRETSSFYSYLYQSTDYISTGTSNLYLEFIAGLGWLGMIFILWWIISAKNILSLTKGRDIYVSLFFAISAIFLVDPVYLVPTFYWLWMALLGLIQARGGSEDL